MSKSVKLLVTIFCLFLLIGNGIVHADNTNDEPFSMEELEGKRVGIQMGSVLSQILPELIKDVKIVYFEDFSDMREALLSGKVDAISTDEPKLRYMAARDPQIEYRKEVFEYMEYAFVLNKEKGQALCDELNQYIRKQKKNGFFNEMINAWFDPDQIDREIPDYESLPSLNGTITYAVDARLEPFVFIKDGKYSGLEVEIIARFCEERGYGLQIVNTQFASLLPGVYSGKYDIGSSSITITEERAENVLFSDSIYTGGATIAIKKQSSENTGRPDVSAYADKRMAILTGSNFPELIAQKFPQAEQIFFNSVADMLSGLQANKVDAIVLDDPVARNVVIEAPETLIAEGYLDKVDFAYIFNKDKGSAICDEVSSFIREIKADGRLNKLQEKWFDSIPDESKMAIDPNDLVATNGTLRVSALQYPPFVVVGQNMIFGYEAEVLVLFGKERGYKIEFIDMSADGLIPTVITGKCDIGMSAISVTEERKEEILFSEPTYSGSVVLVVRGEEAETGTSFIDSVIDSFEKTFIRENRYRLFLQGIATTLFITIASIIFGTGLGFLIFLACRNGNEFALRLSRFFSLIMTGMPMLVILMILYYVIFGRSSISSTLVSIIGFSLVFSAEVSDTLKTAVSAVDKGQREAAYALGYSDRDAFFRHILPQAIPFFLPSYRGSLVSLVKATAVVGYIAVEDLTKMGDIVRSRTYEAFFPLIAVALIYFVLGRIMVFVVDRLTLSLDPTRRNKNKILKGIDIHD